MNCRSLGQREPVDRAILLRMVNLFEETHHKTYGHRGHDNIIELVNLRLVANGLSIRPRVPDVRLNFNGKLRLSRSNGRSGSVQRSGCIIRRLWAVRHFPNRLAVGP